MVALTLDANSSLQIEVLRWSAWAPEITSIAQWISWAAESPNQLPGFQEPPEVPALKYLPALFRRRCSRLGKIGIEIAYRCLPPELRSCTPSVFASRYGETCISFEILEQLARQETPSPLSFGLSVHNTASGLFSIATKNQMPSTTISAGRDTFANAFLETCLQAICRPSQPILLVMLEEPLPMLFRKFCNEGSACVGLGLLLQFSAHPSSDGVIKLTFPAKAETLAPPLPQSLNFISWLLSAEPSLILGEGKRSFCFEKTNFHFHSIFSSNVNTSDESKQTAAI